MLRSRASVTTSDEEMRRNRRRPFGLRRQGAVCGVAPPQHISPLICHRRRSLHPTPWRSQRTRILIYEQALNHWGKDTLLLIPAQSFCLIRSPGFNERGILAQ